jgi:hypothetical protein
MAMTTCFSELSSSAQATSSGPCKTWRTIMRKLEKVDERVAGSQLDYEMQPFVLDQFYRDAAADHRRRALQA